MEHVQPQTQALSDKQREAFARLIADAKKQAQAKAEDDSDLKDRIEKEVAPQIAKDRGALALGRMVPGRATTGTSTTNMRRSRLGRRVAKRR